MNIKFEAIPTKELEDLEKSLVQEISRRKENRKRELWDSVVAAMQKFEKECGEIKFINQCVYHVEFRKDKPGILT